MNTLNQLNIDSIRVNYIFSFFIGTKVGDEQKILYWDKETQDKKPFSKLLEEEIFSSNVYSSVEFHTSEEREPLNNRSAIYFTFPHLSITKSSRKIYIKNLFQKEIEGELRIHLALFETGMGLMWSSIQVDNIEIENDELSKINQRKKIPIITINGNDKLVELTPYQIFHDEVSFLVKELNTAVGNQFSKYQYYWDSKFWIDSNNDYERGLNISQEPSIAIFIKSNNYLDFTDNQEFQFYLSSILHGTDLKFLDIIHANEHIGSNYINLYPSKKFLTRVHGNCLLVFHNEEYEKPSDQIENYNSFKEFNYGLFRTYCAVRGTWHIYNILNEEIDKELTELNRKIDSGFHNINKANEIKQNIIFKSHFLQFLNSEDPFVRGIGLTPFSKLHKDVCDVYKTEDIKENIKYKLTEYDKLIQQINNYDFLNVDIKRKHSKSPILIYPIIGLLLILTIVFLKFAFKIPLLNNNLLFIISISITGVLTLSSFIFIVISKPSI